MQEEGRTMPPTQPLSSSSTNSSHSDRWFPYRKSADFDTNLVIILIILLCALTGVLALNGAIRCLLRRRDSSPRSNLSDGDVSKPPQAVVAIPSMEFSSAVKLAGAGAECAICLSEFVSGELLRVLPKCKHGFHEKCIEVWLASGSSCPTCRTSFLIMPMPEKAAAGRSEVELLPGRMMEP